MEDKWTSGRFKGVIKVMVRLDKAQDFCRGGFLKIIQQKLRKSY